jgi:hypothetical protein
MKTRTLALLPTNTDSDDLLEFDLTLEDVAALRKLKARQSFHGCWIYEFTSDTLLDNLYPFVTINRQERFQGDALCFLNYFGEAVLAWLDGNLSLTIQEGETSDED